ncbi:ester cyclase [Stutzerimonas stutzeri]|uniref:ester cyclase n=1 Tax=Stutzerimonas stutzeri TaxID=316 RepID=UPI001C2EAB26|nr:ester cyclase [Stutzerimonas stutzeri]
MSPDERKRRVRQHIDLSWSKGRLALAEQLQSRYFSYKSSFIAQPVNSAGFGLIVREIRQAMPDLEVVVDECLSDGNRVVTSSTLFGTLVKTAFGHPPTGKILTVAAMSIWTLNPGGDIEEINTLFDLESARKQMGMDTPMPVTLPPT